MNRKAFDTSFLYWVDFTNFWKSFLMRFLCFMSCNELKLSNYFCQIVVGNFNRLNLLWSLHNISIDESHRTRLGSHIAHKHFGGVGCNEPPPSLGIPVSAGSVEREWVHFQSWPQCIATTVCCCLCQWWCCLLSASPCQTATHYSRLKLLLPWEKSCTLPQPTAYSVQCYSS